MTWKDAIIKVLLDEGAPMHYSDITNKIFENGYREKAESGATPNLTVNAQLTTNKNLFQQLGGGVYTLIAKSGKTSIGKETKSEDNLVKQEETTIQRNRIIKNFGMFWSRSEINWRTMNLYGTQIMGSTSVNFKEQCGIYLLHDAREVIYIGQAVKQPLSKRLADHCKDRLSGR